MGEKSSTVSETILDSPKLLASFLLNQKKKKKKIRHCGYSLGLRCGQQINCQAVKWN